MTPWTLTEQQQITATDDLHVAPLRDDGVTSGTLTWSWSVVVDGQVDVRAYNGTASRWYQVALRQKAGRITAAGMTREVTFEPVSSKGEFRQQIDEAYRAKYAGNPSLAPMIDERARVATMCIVPDGGHA